MKKIYAVVRAIQAVSGWTWDDKTGASIDHATADSWDAYVAQHKDAKPFRNAGWIHLATVSRIMPSTTRGTNVFRASDASTGPGGAGVEIEDDQPAQASPPASQHGSEEPEEPEEVDSDRADIPGPVRLPRYVVEFCD